MATWMKLWIGLTLTGMALVAAFALPPEPPSVRMNSERGSNTIEQQTRELRVAVDTRLAAVQRIRWSDSLSQLAVDAAPGDFVLGYPDPSELEAEVLQDHERWVSEELAGLDRRDETMAFGYFNQAADFAAAAPIRIRRSENVRGYEETYVGVRDGRPYCMQIRAVSPSGFARDFNQRTKTLRALKASGESPLTSYLGLCRPYVRHGMAGERIQEWLDAGAYAFAQRHMEDRVQLATLEAQGVVVPTPAAERQLRRLPFGLGGRTIGNSAIIEPDQCAIGNTDACRAAVTEPHLLTESPHQLTAMSPMNDPGHNRSFSSPFRFLDDYLLDDLEAEFGAEAFSAFWTSDAEVTVAFESAFGMGIGEWVAGWLEARTRGHIPGPRLPRFDLLLSFAAVTLLGLWATAWSSGRRAT